MGRNRILKASSGPNLRTKTEKIILSIFFVLFFAYALTLIAPMFWTLYNSLKTMRTYNEDPFFIPSFKEMMWENYEKIFDEDFITVSIPFAIFNTVLAKVYGSSLSIRYLKYFP